MVLEPLVQGAAGMLVAEPDDVRRVGEACRAAGVLLVCDEVATGFGRTGTLFASEQCGLRPDLLCLGKGITGGYLAMSATVASGGSSMRSWAPTSGRRPSTTAIPTEGTPWPPPSRSSTCASSSPGTCCANVRARAAQLAELLADARSAPRAVGARGPPARA